MTLTRLLLRNLLYHWRGNVAVLLGVAVGTAVLTGALLVGDSLRGSLRALTLEQLNGVDYALVAGRFVRQDLARELHASPALILQGAVSLAPPSSDGISVSPPVSRAGRVMIYGVDDDRPLVALPKVQPDTPVVFLNAALARDLGAKDGDEVTLHVQKASGVPRETLLGHREAGAVLENISLPARVLPADYPGGRFSLNPSPAAPRNAFVPLAVLQEELDQEGRVNALLVGRGEENPQGKLHGLLTLDDWGLVLHDPESRTRELFAKLDKDGDGKLTPREYRRQLANHFVEEADANGDKDLTRDEVAAYYRSQEPYLSLESRQMLLEPAVADAALAAAKDAGLQAGPTLVYLANGISDGTATVPYSVVAALDPTEPLPLGQYLPAGVRGMSDKEIVLAHWKDSPQQARPGDRITLTYFEPEEQGRLQEKEAAFTLREVPPQPTATRRIDLAPEFPGITDKLSIRDWNPPFPYHKELVKKEDERYWEDYRTTPKAYVTLAAGQQLWGSRFGNLTSIRLVPASGGPQPAEGSAIAEDYRRRLLEHLDPAKGGLVFDAVRQRGLESSAGFTDFGVLFLAFSVFLIAAALLLVGLLFRLNLDRRAAEVGLLLATGFRRWAVRSLLLMEGIILALVGGMVGLVGAVGYAGLMLELLRSWWRGGAIDESFLRLHAAPASFAIGYVAAVVVSVLTVFWAVRGLGRLAPRALLVGATTEDGVRARRGARWSLWVAGVAAAGALACVVAGSLVQDAEAKAGSFFGSGFFLLVAGLAAVWAWMRANRRGSARPTLTGLGVRNAARHPVRSLLTAGQLASATFLVVAVESFHRDPDRDFLDPHGGSGGFNLFAESDVPLFQDLNTPKGRDELNFPDGAAETLKGVTIYSFRLRAGDDASCLNLYQPRRPRVLGVPLALMEQNRFSVPSRMRVSGQYIPEPKNPWDLLKSTHLDGAVPAFGDANTVQWMLHSGLKQVIEVPEERGYPRSLRFVGLLQGSIFQSEVLISEENFLHLYPRQEGYQFFLIAAPPEKEAEVKQLLETALAPQGFTVTPTKRRVEAYLAVENTYLGTFQALGGLGLVLGALGLAVVLLRSVWERRGELALLRALGFRQAALGWLVLAENGFLLLLGLGVGTVTALVAVAPHLVAGRGAVPWPRLVGLLAAVLAVGLVSAGLAVLATLRAPLLTALRRE